MSVGHSSYRDVLAEIDDSGLLAQLFDGSVRIPDDCDQPPGSYGFPPALVPLWSEGSGPSYWGVWRHWFGCRPPSFVRMSLEDGHRVREVARTVAQLVRVVVLELVVTADELTEPIRAFATACGVDDLEEIDAISLESGDDPRGLARLPAFASRTPLSVMTDTSGYDGDFPRSVEVAGHGRWDEVSPFECDQATSAWAHGSSSAPAWFQAKPALVFEDAMARRDLHSAWMALNSPGWRFSSAKEAVGRLAAAAGDASFTRLARAWAAEPSERFGGY